MKTIKFVFYTFGFLGFIYALILLYVYFYQGEMIFNASKLERL
jgi:bacteriorhodopsin